MVSLLRPAKPRVEKTGTKTKDFSECQSVVLIAEEDYGQILTLAATAYFLLPPYLESAQKQKENNGQREVLTLEKVKREKRASEERE